MVPFWSRLKNGALQNLTATYFRGLFANDMAASKYVSQCRRSYSLQKCLWPPGSHRNWVTGGVYLFMMVPGNSRLLTHTNTVPICNYFFNSFLLKTKNNKNQNLPSHLSKIHCDIVIFIVVFLHLFVSLNSIFFLFVFLVPFCFVCLLLDVINSVGKFSTFIFF